MVLPCHRKEIRERQITLSTHFIKPDIRLIFTAVGLFYFVLIVGDLVSVYTSLGYHHAVSDVQFHPLDHIIAFCSFGDAHPVLVYHYDPKGLARNYVVD